MNKLSKLKRLIILAGIVFVALWSISATPAPEKDKSYSRGVTSPKNTGFSCLGILREVASAAGFEGGETYTTDDTDLSRGFIWCQITLHQEMTDPESSHYFSVDDANIGIMTVDDDPEYMHGGVNTTRLKSSFHGFPALLEFNEPLSENPYLFHWYVPEYKLVFWFSAYSYDIYRNEESTSSHEYSTPDPFAVAETYYAIVHNRIPDMELPPPEDSVIVPTVEVTEEEPQVVVVPFGAETQEPAGEDPQVQVIPFGEDSTSETVPAGESFEEAWQSEQARAIRSPYLPILGGLLGGGAAWLFAQGGAKAASYVASASAAQTVSQPPAITPELPQTPPPVATSPPPLMMEPPPLVMEPPEPVTELPDNETADVLTPGQAGYNILKEAVNATGNIAGVYDKYLAGKDSAETLKAVREAIRNWHMAPSAETSKKYLEKLNNLNALKENKLADKLGYVSKAIDLYEAGKDAARICAERGYTGWEAAGTVYAKVAEKAIVWVATKNPVVGLADAAVGGATQLVFGKENRIDLGSVVDKAHDTIDKVSKSAFDKYFYNKIEAVALQDKNVNVQNLVERIRRQVEEGTITKNEGAYRLQRVLDKVNRETPKI